MCNQVTFYTIEERFQNLYKPITVHKQKTTDGFLIMH